jgi:hypothetical protein
MDKNIIFKAYLTFTIFFTTFNLYAGVNLVQSFEETFTTGDGYFGCSVSEAGDVNSDGYDDVIVGAYGYSSSAGRAYVFFGGSSMNNTVDVTMAGEAIDNYFGYSVSGAGDVNSDEYDDVIVGAYGYSTNRDAYEYDTKVGRAYVYYGGFSMDNTADVTMTGEWTSDYFGHSVSDAGDLNNDGYDDVIVGAYGYSSYAGRAYVFFGGSSMNNTADVTMTGEATDHYFGYSVSGAEDVNSDGYDDVIVGAYGYNTNFGRAYVFFGGSSMDNTADVNMPGRIYNYFGNSVSGAGDVNSDGYDDVIVGAYGYSTNNGRAYVFFGGSSMNNTADVTMTGEATNNYFGYSVSGAGDANSDGYDDVIVGAYGYSANNGRAYVYFGGPSMDNTADVTMTGEATNNYFGYSVSGAGDANNDGYDDVIVGASRYSLLTGSAYVYFGGSSMDNTVDVTITGEATNNYFGGSVSGAGDVNSDGYDDVIVGACYYNNWTGRAYVYYGGSSMDNTADVTMTGGAYYLFGSSVSGAGDVNSDGYDDVIVGACYYNNWTGRAYVYYGGSSMDNSVDVTMAESGDYFGCSVSGAGDVNGDGYDDVIVGAYRYIADNGRAYVFFGGSSMNNTADVTMTGEATNNYFGCSVSGAGDVNSDGYDDVIVGAWYYNDWTGRAYVYYGGSSMDNTSDVTMTGESAGGYFGYSVSGAGDVNNDGYDDVIVGAYHSFYFGQAYVYYGGSSMDNTADVTMMGEAPAAHLKFGSSVSGAGDVNGDGYDDVIVGDDWYSSSTGHTGRAYVYYGGSSMDNIVDVTMTGESTNNYFGYPVSGAGDVNGDGIDDVIVGAYGYNGSNGKAYIYSIFINSKINAWLEGPYQAGGSMTTALKTAGFIPFNSPYPDGRVVSVVPDGVTDWVSLELRTADTGPSVSQRSFFLKSNGTVVDADGSTTDLKMPGLADGNYYLLVRHRNHLSAMSALSISLNTSSASLYDFSTGLSQYYGGDAKLLETGVYGLYSGDANGSGTVDASDRSATWNGRNQNGYLDADCNLSGTVDASDRSITWNNRNKATSVP